MSLFILYIAMEVQRSDMETMGGLREYLNFYDGNLLRLWNSRYTSNGIEYTSLWS